MRELGDKIRRARIEKNLTFQDLYERTRIPVTTIEAIENGSAEFLPTAHYRAFVRTLAKEVGLDPGVILKEYDERKEKRIKEREELLEGDDVPVRFHDFFLHNKKIVMISSVSILFFLLVFLYLKYGRSLFVEPDFYPGNIPMSDSTSLTPSDSSCPLILNCTGIKDTWIQISVDSGRNEDIHIQKGERYSRKYKKTIFIGFDDPEAVRLDLCGRDIDWSSAGEGGVDIWIHSDTIYSIEPRHEPSRNKEGGRKERVTFPLIMGSVTRERLFSELPSFREKFNRYNPDSIVILNIRENDPEVRCLCFFAAWDSVSNVVISRFLKVCSAGGFRNVSVDLIGVDEKMDDGEGMVERYRVQGIPTIIFLHRDLEIGRIAGQPVSRIEVRFLEITNKITRYTSEDSRVERDTVYQNDRYWK